MASLLPWTVLFRLEAICPGIISELARYDLTELVGTRASFLG